MHASADFLGGVERKYSDFLLVVVEFLNKIDIFVWYRDLIVLPMREPSIFKK